MKTGLLLLALLAPVEQLDAIVQEQVQRGRCPALEPVMRGASGVGRPAIVLSALLAIALFDAAGPATARFAIAALIPTNLMVEGIKFGVDRPRPDGERKRSNASFPSSHAANASALAWVLSRRWRRLAPLWWIAAILVSFSRLYLNRHYLSDVMVGLALGAACAWLAGWILDLRARRTAAESGAPEISAPAGAPQP